MNTDRNDWLYVWMDTAKRAVQWFGLALDTEVRCVYDSVDRPQRLWAVRRSANYKRREIA